MASHRDPADPQAMYSTMTEMPCREAARLAEPGAVAVLSAAVRALGDAATTVGRNALMSHVRTTPIILLRMDGVNYGKARDAGPRPRGAGASALQTGRATQIMSVLRSSSDPRAKSP